METDHDNPASTPASEAHLRAIAGVLSAQIPAGYERLVLDVRASWRHLGAVLNAYDALGHRLNLKMPDEVMDVTDEIEELRQTMYREGVGTWFTATFTAGAGSMRSTFNFDREIEGPFPEPSGAYRIDLEHFPRDAAHTPGWLQRRLDEGTLPRPRKLLLNRHAGLLDWFTRGGVRVVDDKPFYFVIGTVGNVTYEVRFHPTWSSVRRRTATVSHGMVFQSERWDDVEKYLTFVTGDLVRARLDQPPLPTIAPEPYQLSYLAEGFTFSGSGRQTALTWNDERGEHRVESIDALDAIDFSRYCQLDLAALRSAIERPDAATLAGAQGIHWVPVPPGSRYSQSPAGPISFAPAYSRDMLLGYLWHRDEDAAAGFVARDDAGDPGRNASAIWMGALFRGKTEGYAPSAAFADLIKWPGNAQSGALRAAEAGTAEGIGELRRIAASARERRVG